MSKHIADDFLGNTCSKQTYGTCMSECMWTALANRLYAGSVQAPAYDRVEARAIRKAPIRSTGSNENLSGIGHRPSFAQVL